MITQFKPELHSVRDTRHHFNATKTTPMRLRQHQNNSPTAHALFQTTHLGERRKWVLLQGSVSVQRGAKNVIGYEMVS
jgi:hypothetical protein